MTALIPNFFLEAASTIANLESDKIERLVKKVAMAAILALALYQISSIPFAGAAIMLVASYYDRPVTNCAGGMISSFTAYRLGSVSFDCYRVGYPIPLEIGLLCLLATAIAWYCFNFADG